MRSRTPELTGLIQDVRSIVRNQGVPLLIEAQELITEIKLAVRETRQRADKLDRLLDRWSQ